MEFRETESIELKAIVQESIKKETDVMGEQSI